MSRLISAADKALRNGQIRLKATPNEPHRTIWAQPLWCYACLGDEDTGGVSVRNHLRTTDRVNRGPSSWNGHRDDWSMRTMVGL